MEKSRRLQAKMKNNLLMAKERLELLGKAALYHISTTRRTIGLCIVLCSSSSLSAWMTLVLSWNMQHYIQRHSREDLANSFHINVEFNRAVETDFIYGVSLGF